MSDDRPTPVDGFHLTGQKAHTLEEILETVTSVLNESRDIKLFSQRACESALAIAAAIPELKKKQEALDKRLDRVVMFQAWFPTVLVTVAILARVLWLR